MNKPILARKKPIIVQALQWTGDNKKAIEKFMEDYKYAPVFPKSRKTVIIYTLEGDIAARKGDFIIKGVRGEFYPCKPEVFIQTYEQVK